MSNAAQQVTIAQVGRVIASDPKRNLYNQRFSPDQRWIALPRRASDRVPRHRLIYVTPTTGGAWRGDYRWQMVRRQAAVGARTGGSYISCRIMRGVANVWGRRFDDFDRHSRCWRSISSDIVPIRAVPVDAAHGAQMDIAITVDTAASAHDRISQRDLDAGSGRSLNRSSICDVLDEPFPTHRRSLLHILGWSESDVVDDVPDLVVRELPGEARHHGRGTPRLMTREDVAVRRRRDPHASSVRSGGWLTALFLDDRDRDAAL